MTMRMSIQTDQTRPSRFASPGVGAHLLGWLRLFRIELRRSPVILAAVVIALLTWWQMRAGLRVGVVRWRDISYVAGNPIIEVSAIAAAMAAFVAGREYRRRTVEQVSVSSFGRIGRDLAVALPVLLWCVAGYMVVVAGFFLYAAMHATWGGPEWAYAQIALAATVAGVAFGWLVGTVARHRLVPLLVMGFVAAAHVSYPVTQQFRVVERVQPDGNVNFMNTESWWRLLVPWEMLDFVTVSGIIALGTLWLVALAALFWCAAWWWSYRSALALACGALAAMVAGVAGAGLGTNDARDRQFHTPAYVQPVCETRLEGQIAVCLHPQDAALLDESAGTIAGLMEPIAGISGVPARFEGQQGERIGEDHVLFSLYDATTVSQPYFQESIIREVVRPPSVRSNFGMDAPQYVVTAWLLEEAGIPVREDPERYLFAPLSLVLRAEPAQAAGISDWDELDRRYGVDLSRDELDAFEAEVHGALERFHALPDDERRAWLTENWAALTSGELALEDLP